MAKMIIFSTTAVYSALLITLSGVFSSPLIGTLARPTPTEPTPVLIQTYEGEIDECAPRLLAEQNNTHDIACIMESVTDVITDQLSSNPGLSCGPNDEIFYGNSFPALYRALVETVTALEHTEVALPKLNESMCVLKKLAATGLNTTVMNHCSCNSSSQECASNAVPSNLTSDGVNHDETCLLANLKNILRKIKTELGGGDVTCRRASNTQQDILVSLEKEIVTYYHVVAPPEIFGTITLPPSPCLYSGSDLSTHIKSLYTLAPYLSNLTSCEAQKISRNISEVVFPVIKQLLGDIYVEHITNSSMPFSTQQEASYGLLNEQGQTICLVVRLSTIYRRFMSVLRKDNVFISEHCVQDSH